VLRMNGKLSAFDAINGPATSSNGLAAIHGTMLSSSCLEKERAQPLASQTRRDRNDKTPNVQQATSQGIGLFDEIAPFYFLIELIRDRDRMVSIECLSVKVASFISKTASRS